MMVIGLTGNLGAGKTTVAQMFAQLGAAVVDADEIAHNLLIEKGPCRRNIGKEFPDAVKAGGVISRDQLAKAVFKNEKKLKILEGILHPVVDKRIKQMLYLLQKTKKNNVVVVDIPLLFEVGIDRRVDVVIVVKANSSQQIERVMKSRGMTYSSARARLRRQMPQQEKLKRADFVIDNRFSKAKTRTQVKRIWEGLVHV